MLRHAHIRAEKTAEFIHDYFNLPVNLSSLYEYWESQHLIHQSRPKKLLPFKAFQGIRILRQDPWETTVSFICSSNNNVKRILKMCENLCVHFGNLVGEYEDIPHYSFPSPQDLMESHVESTLRELGFGYRARYIHQTAYMMTASEMPEITRERLNDMRDQDYGTAHEFLLQLTGVGPKVADCICLMALDKHDIVPVDTHVYQIAIREYKYSGNASIKTMNKAIYSGIREYFKSVFGPYAGWAQLVLFASDLSDLINGQNVSDEKVLKSIAADALIKEEAEVKSFVDMESSNTVKKERIGIAGSENSESASKTESHEPIIAVEKVKREVDSDAILIRSNKKCRSERFKHDSPQIGTRRSIRIKVKVE